MTPPDRDPLRISALPLAQRPVARLFAAGPTALTDAELLAVLIQTDTLETAAQLLHHFGGWPGLARVTPTDLQTHGGIGPARCAQIKAAVEIGRRTDRARPDAPRAIRAPADAAALLHDMGDLEQEQLRVILLTSKNHVQQIVTVYVGMLNGISVRVGEIFKAAIRANSAGIIVAHNHPSRSPEPSPEDVCMTKELVAAGKLLGIDVRDHLIIAQGRFVSLRERGFGGFAS